MAAVGGSFLALVMLAGVLLRDRVPPLDSWIVDHLYSAPGTARATLATTISGAGSVFGLVVLLSVVGGIWWRLRGAATGLLLRSGALLATCSSTVVLQTVFQRPGPAVTDQDWTYPSGHIVLLAALGGTAVLLSRSLSATWRNAVAGSLIVMIGLVAASRMTLGEHWLIDVVAALVVTVGSGLVAAIALRLL
ncbi:phosphatase PAP2 family protein [Nocardia sp. NPDC049149]|uniref:phosphatase PAP2 family protein n=1 Tax=Nocardia sp. NPDC049149 TaxID=3364315 RepID=UPI003717E330